MNDILSVMDGKLLNGDIIDGFLYSTASQQKRNGICLSLLLFEKLQMCELDNDVVRNLLKGNLVNDYDIIIIPIHVPGGVGHFSLMVIYQNWLL